MKHQKTINLGDMVRVNGNTVEQFSFVGWDEENGWPIYNWTPTRYKIGAQGVLVSNTDVSPNAVRENRSIDRFSLVFDCPDGIPGNSNPNITRFHGWRGTTDDNSQYAHGLRKIIKIRELKNGTVSVTLTPDLNPSEA